MKREHEILVCCELRMIPENSGSSTRRNIATTSWSSSYLCSRSYNFHPPKRHLQILCRILEKMLSSSTVPCCTCCRMLQTNLCPEPWRSEEEKTPRRLLGEVGVRQPHAKSPTLRSIHPEVRPALRTLPMPPGNRQGRRAPAGAVSACKETAADSHQGKLDAA